MLDLGALAQLLVIVITLAAGLFLIVQSIAERVRDRDRDTTSRR